VSTRADFAVAVAVLAFGILLIVFAQQLDLPPARDPLGPKALPTATGIVIAAVGVGVAIRRWRGWRGDALVTPEGTEDDEGPGLRPGSARRAFSIWATALLYLILLPWLGYLLATPAFVGMVLTLMNWSNAMPRAVVSGAFTVAMFVLFHHLLNVPVPLGILTDFMRAVGLS